MSVCGYIRIFWRLTDRKLWRFRSLGEDESGLWSYLLTAHHACVAHRAALEFLCLWSRKDKIWRFSECKTPYNRPSIKVVSQVNSSLSALALVLHMHAEFSKGLFTSREEDPALSSS